uniref:Uncharacterized protein n=1 Tax=Rhizochromulina marina TaxID=1034831 RepID=A0A7S2RE10_9STRA
MVAVAQGVLLWVEYGLQAELSVLYEARTLAKTLPNAVAMPENQGKLVHVSTGKTGLDFMGSAYHLKDDLLGLYFSARDITARRVPEYCQWSEIKHVLDRVIGREPDYCTATNAAGCTSSCASLSASSCSRGGRGEGGGPCCTLHRGADIIEQEVSFSYHKAWRPHRINSLLFDNAITYHNPSRDPAPPVEHITSADVVMEPTADSVSTLTVQVQHILSSATPWASALLPPDAHKNVSGAALSAGFYEVDHMFYHSRVSADGAESFLAGAGKAAAAYLLEGVVDVNTIARGIGLESLLDRAGLGWITRGTCNAGDVRVHFETRQLPAALTVVGDQEGQYVAPHTYSNGQVRLLVLPSVESLDTFVHTTSQQARRGAYLNRFLVFLLVVAAFYTGGDGTRLSKTGPRWARVPLDALLAVSVLLAGCWAWWYSIMACMSAVLVAGAVVGINQVVLAHPGGGPSEGEQAQADSPSGVEGSASGRQYVKQEASEEEEHADSDPIGLIQAAAEQEQQEEGGRLRRRFVTNNNKNDDE